MMETLETKSQEPRLEIEYIEQGIKHRITYYGNITQLRKGIYELFIDIYKQVRNDVQPKQ